MFRIVAVAAVLAGAVLEARKADAQEYRIETQVFTEDREQPIGTSLSLFQNGIAYDFMDEVGEITVFDPYRRRFTIVDTGEGIATVLTFDEIDQAVGELRRQTEERLRELQGASDERSRRLMEATRFLLDPRFEETFDRRESLLDMNSPGMQYQVRCEPAPSEPVANQLREYSDWHAKLNVLLNTVALSPYPRMAVDEALYRRRLVPVELTLSVRFGAPSTVRTSHRVAWELTQADRGRLARLDLRNLRYVAFDEYNRLVGGSGAAAAGP